MSRNTKDKQSKIHTSAKKDNSISKTEMVQSLGSVPKNHGTYRKPAGGSVFQRKHPPVPKVHANTAEREKLQHLSKYPALRRVS